MAYGAKTSTEDRGDPKSLGNDAKKSDLLRVAFLRSKGLAKQASQKC